MIPVLRATQVALWLTVAGSAVAAAQGAAGADTMSYGARRVRLEPEYRTFRDGELYVGAERLGDLLGSPFIVDFSELTVTLADPGDLPVARRLRREAARTALLRPREAAHPDLLLAAQRPRWDGLVFDYT